MSLAGVDFGPTLLVAMGGGGIHGGGVNQGLIARETTGDLKTASRPCCIMITSPVGIRGNVHDPRRRQFDS